MRVLEIHATFYREDDSDIEDEDEDVIISAITDAMIECGIEATIHTEIREWAEEI